MKLFKIEVRFAHRRRGRTGIDAIVHARSRGVAENYVQKKFTGCEIVSTLELADTPKHFIVADLVE